MDIFHRGKSRVKKRPDSDSSKSLEEGVGIEENEQQVENMSDEEIEDLFEQLMSRRGIHETATRQKMASFPIEKKRLMVSQDIQYIISDPMKKKTKAEDTEYYIRKLSDLSKGINTKVISHLSVSLRTMPLSWVREFIDMRGLQIITNLLTEINRVKNKNELYVNVESDLLKCFKALLNNRVGVREALQNPHCIDQIVICIASPAIQSRRLVCEVLAFICYYNVPVGHDLVLKAMDKLRNKQKGLGRFDAWFNELDITLGGRGRMGSMVGASDDFRKMMVQPGSPDNLVTEYTLYNMILVNAIINVVDDPEVRIHLRNQMNASGLENILKKMNELSDDHVDRQISEFKMMAENDQDDMMELYNEQVVLNDLNDPRQVFECIISSVQGTRGYDFFVSCLQHLLLINTSEEEASVRSRYFQIIDNLVTQVVLDHKGLRNSSNFTGDYNTTVRHLLDKFADQDQLKQTLQDLEDLQKDFDGLKVERDELKDQLSKKGDALELMQLREKTASLEDLLRMSRHTISTLQTKLRDLQANYDENAAIKTEVKDLFSQSTLNDSDRSFGRLCAQESLEGRTSVTSNKLNKIGGVEEDKERHKSLALGLSEEFKIQLARQFGSSNGLGEFVLPGTMPLMGSATRRQNNRRKQVIVQTDDNDDDLQIPAINHAQIERTSVVQKEMNRKHDHNSSISIPSIPPISTTTSSVDNDDDDSFSQVMTKDKENTMIESIESSEKIELESITSDTGALTKATPETVSSETVPSNTLLSETEVLEIGAPNVDSSSTMILGESKDSEHLASSESKSHNAGSKLSALSEASSQLDTSSTNLPQDLSSHVSSLSGTASSKTTTDDAGQDEVSENTGAVESLPSSATSNVGAGTNAVIATTTGAPPPPPPAPPLPPPQPSSTYTTVLTKSIMTATVSEASSASPSIENTSGSLGPPPPPPPPPPPGPPPPPNGPGTMSAAALRKQLNHLPSVKTRQLQWQKLDHQTIQSTIWIKASERDEEMEQFFDSRGIFKHMERVFAQRVIEKQQQKMKKQKEEKRPEICIIDSRKAYNINITVLSKIKNITFTAFKNKILQFDKKWCTEVLLKNLLANIPSHDEMGKLSVFIKTASEEDLESLSKADKFCAEMITIDRLKERITNMLFMTTFNERITQLGKNMSYVMDASTQLKESMAFQELLNLILLVGNFLNGSNFQGGAFGIRISSINKLVDTRASSNESTLLHFIITMIEDQFTSINEHLLSDLSLSKEACRVTIQDLIKDYNELRVGLQTLIHELEYHHYDNEDENPFLNNMIQFREGAMERFDQLEIRYTAMDIAYKDVVSYFGENPSDMKPDEFFGIFSTFMSSWQKAKSDIELEKKKRAQLEKQKEYHEQHKAATIARRLLDSSKVAPENQDDDKDIMDNLLEKLRSGEMTATSKNRRDRRKTRAESMMIKAEDLLRHIQTDEHPLPNNNTIKT